MADSSSWHLDTSVIIAIARKEDRQDANEVRGVKEIEKEINRNGSKKRSLRFSAMAYYECYPKHQSNLDKRERIGKQVEDWMDRFRHTVSAVGVSPNIASTARTLRQQFQSAVDQNHQLSNCDWIHLATAIELSASHFFTFDQGILTVGKQKEVLERISVWNPSELLDPGPIFAT